MNTVQLRFAKRIVPVQYEYEELEITFAVDADANLVARTNEMKAFVYDSLYGKTNPAITQENNSLKGETNGQVKQESIKENSSKSSKKSRSKVKEEVSETSSSSETSEEMEDVPSPYTAEAPSEPSKEEVKAETKTATPNTATKSKKETSIVYDRENPDHRSTMSNFLVKLTGGKEWSKDKEKSKKASAELTGKPFLDKDGSILPSFQELCKEKFGVTSDAL